MGRIPGFAGRDTGEAVVGVSPRAARRVGFARSVRCRGFDGIADVPRDGPRDAGALRGPVFGSVMVAPELVLPEFLGVGFDLDGALRELLCGGVSLSGWVPAGPGGLPLPAFGEGFLDEFVLKWG